MINNYVGVGRLTADPELKYSPSGVAVCRFRLAINRSFKNEQGQQQADFINCIAWRKQAENVANFLKKGSLAGITGSIQTGSYDGQDGRKVYTWEVNCNNVQFLDNKGAQEGSNGQGNTNYHPPQQNANTGQYRANNYQSSNSDPFSNANDGKVDVKEDDLPFDYSGRKEVKQIEKSIRRMLWQSNVLVRQTA